MTARDAALTPEGVVLGAEAIAEVLAAHPRDNSSAGWNGSPDPSNWRNIRPCCLGCNDRLPDDAPNVGAALRQHQAEQVAALAAGVRGE